jgi:hypothetical protein
MPTPSGNRTRNPSNKATKNLCLNLHDHRDRVRHKEFCRFIERTVSPLQGVRRQILVENIMYE